MIDPEENDESWDAELRGKERLFVLRYCTDSEVFLNATAAYRKVYTKTDEKTGKPIKLAKEVCEAASSRLMKRDRIKIACARLLRQTQADVDERSQYQLLHDLLLCATYNPADIITADGELKVKDLKSLGELAKCVTHIKQTKWGLDVSLADRGRYMTQLLQYLDIIRVEDDNKSDKTLNVVELVKKCVDADEWNRFAEESEANL